MSAQVSSRKVSIGGTSLVSRRMKVATLWTIQGVLACLFLFAGGMKLIVPVEVMLAQMPLRIPGLFVHFIGVCEVAGALGLILPGLTRIGRRLTPLAAWAFVIEMGGATVYTLLGGGGASAVMPLVVGLLCAAVAYGRRSYFATA
ncbi:MAG: DoxX family protein [Ktedonobacterales bacterium]